MIESGRGLPHSTTLRARKRLRSARQLLDCASPLALLETAITTVFFLPNLKTPKSFW